MVEAEDDKIEYTQVMGIKLIEILKK